jgi:hypothetical protein
MRYCSRERFYRRVGLDYEHEHERAIKGSVPQNVVPVGNSRGRLHPTGNRVALLKGSSLKYSMFTDKVSNPERGWTRPGAGRHN